MAKGLELVPADNQGMATYLLRVLEEARGGDDESFVNLPPTKQAQVAHNMLSIIGQQRGVLDVSMGYVAAVVAAKQLWRFHSENYPSLREFLKDTGLGASSVSELASLDVIVPFCQEHEIPIGDILTPENWPKARDALTALKRAAKAGDSEEVEDIVETVQAATNRQAIRDRYRKRRTDPIGHATTFRTKQGKVVLLAITNSEIGTGAARVTGGVYRAICEN